jgi:hypothetical protein
MAYIKYQFKIALPTTLKQPLRIFSIPVPPKLSFCDWLQSEALQERTDEAD